MNEAKRQRCYWKMVDICAKLSHVAPSKAKLLFMRWEMWWIKKGSYA